VSTKTTHRRRTTAAAIGAGVLGSSAIALSMGASLSGLVATITNTTNTASTAALAISETSGGATCNSYDTTATCSTINKYGGTATPLVPGGSQTVAVTFTNNGTVAVTSASLTPGTCVATATAAVGAQTPTTPNTTAGNLCSVLNVKVYQGNVATGTVVYNGSPSGFTAAQTIGNLAAGASQVYTFVVSLPSTATSAVQGQQVSQPLTWTFNA
jgi:hypothetical protein